VHRLIFMSHERALNPSLHFGCNHPHTLTQKNHDKPFILGKSRFYLTCKANFFLSVELVVTTYYNLRIVIYFFPSDKS